MAPVNVTLINHSLTGPVFSGSKQQPFYCNADDIAEIGLGEAEEVPNGASECSSIWNALASLVFNPLYATVENISPEDQANTEWTHFAHTSLNFVAQ